MLKFTGENGLLSLSLFERTKEDHPLNQAKSKQLNSKLI